MKCPVSLICKMHIRHQTCSDQEDLCFNHSIQPLTSLVQDWADTGINT